MVFIPLRITESQVEKHLPHLRAPNLGVEQAFKERVRHRPCPPRRLHGAGMRARAQNSWCSVHVYWTKRVIGVCVFISWHGQHGEGGRRVFEEEGGGEGPGCGRDVIRISCMPEKE